MKLDEIRILLNQIYKEYQEIEKRNNKAIGYIETQIEDDYDYFGLRYHNDEKDKLLDILKGDDKE